MLRPPPISTLFPYTTLFRSRPLLDSLTRPQTPSSFLSFHIRHDPRRGRWASNPLVHDNLRRAASHEKDRKSTRLNSSHVSISYAVFCLKKKKKLRTIVYTHF